MRCQGGAASRISRKLDEALKKPFVDAMVHRQALHQKSGEILQKAIDLLVSDAARPSQYHFCERDEHSHASLLDNHIPPRTKFQWIQQRLFDEWAHTEESLQVSVFNKALHHLLNSSRRRV
jgi:hypothetical protein